MRTIKLTRGFEAMVDDEDFMRVNAFCWTAQICPKSPHLVYGQRYAGKKKTYLHRFILGAPKGVDVDHLNGNTLDNRKENLRLCSRSENLANSHRAQGVSGYRGVSRTKNKKKWRVQIKNKSFGVFDTKEQAAHAYDEAARIEFGEFARLNFPKKGERSALELIAKS
ncbi:MAG: HNH endonuclease [Pikeienuella sp.]